MFHSCCFNNHLNDSFLDVDYSKPICFGSLRHDDNWHIRFFAYEASWLTKLLDAEIDMATTCPRCSVNCLWELYANCMPYAFIKSKDSEACLPIALRLDNNYLGKYGTVLQYEPEPINKTRLIRDKDVAVQPRHRQLFLLPFREIKWCIFSVILLLNIIKRSDIQQQLRNHLINHSVHKSNQDRNHEDELKKREREPHHNSQKDAWKSQCQQKYFTAHAAMRLPWRQLLTLWQLLLQLYEGVESARRVVEFWKLLHFLKNYKNALNWSQI